MDLKPHAPLTRKFLVCLKILIIVSVVVILADLWVLHTYSSLPKEANISELFLKSEVVSGLLSLVQLVMLIVVAIIFLNWIHRTNTNLRSISGETMKYSPGWAVGWFFVPFANLVMPYCVVREIWKVSHKNENIDYGIVNSWWALWVTASIAGEAISRAIDNAETTAQYISSTKASIISDVIILSLFIVTFSMVRRIGEAYSRNMLNAKGVTREMDLPENPAMENEIE